MRTRPNSCAAQPICWHTGAAYLLQSFGMYAAGRIAPRTIGGEVPESFMVQNGFCNYGSRRIAGTEEQDIEVWRHITLLNALRV